MRRYSHARVCVREQGVGMEGEAVYMYVQSYSCLKTHASARVFLSV